MTQEIKSELKSALARFKQRNIAILKGKDNPFFKSKYADLAIILEAVESELAGEGLIITSTMSYVEGNLILETLLEHTNSDEVKKTIFPVFGNKPQELGSSITYARRYNIQSLINLAADDDDGNSSNNAAPVKKKLFPTAKARTDVFNKVMESMNDSEDLAELVTAWTLHKDDVAKLRKSDEQIYLELEKRKNELKASFQAIEPIDDEIPDFSKETTTSEVM